MSLQKEDGDWWQHLSCLYAYNIRTFIVLGYRDDQRIQRAADLMLRTSRKDGGYLCDLHEKGKGRPQKSCVRGAAKALLAFAELPENWEHERCRELVDYFLNRNGVYRRNDHQSFVNKDMMSDSYPIIWSTNVWEILYGLAKMGYGKDERLADVWKLQESRKDDDGRYILDRTPTQCPWKVGKKGEPNKWITLYCILAKKYRDNERYSSLSAAPRVFS